MKSLAFLGRFAFLLAISGASLAAQAGLKEGLEATKAHDYDRGFREILPAAEAGSALAQRYAGMYYDLGWGRPESDPLAIDWYRRAAEANDATAKARLAFYYFTGTLGVAKDCQKARSLAIQAAEQQAVLAYQLLSRSYRSDICGTPDFGEAVKWSIKAAERGDSGSEHFVGVQYWRGNGVRQDFDEAHKWFLRSAKQGNAAGMIGLGMMYLGDGRPRDLISAITWLRLAQLVGVPSGDKDRLDKTIAYWSRSVTETQEQEISRRVVEFKPHSRWAEFIEREWQKEFEEAVRWDDAHR